MFTSSAVLYDAATHNQQQQHISRATYASVAPNAVTSVLYLANIIHTSPAKNLPAFAGLPRRLAPINSFRVLAVLVPHPGGSLIEQDEQSKAHAAACLVSSRRAGPIATHMLVFFLGLLRLMRFCIIHAPPQISSRASNEYNSSRAASLLLCDSHRRCSCVYVHVYALLYVPRTCAWCVGCHKN